jgi:hypothetical protein
MAQGQKHQIGIWTGFTDFGSLSFSASPSYLDLKSELSWE